MTSGNKRPRTTKLITGRLRRGSFGSRSRTFGNRMGSDVTIEVGGCPRARGWAVAGVPGCKEWNTPGGERPGRRAASGPCECGELRSVSPAGVGWRRDEQEDRRGETAGSSGRWGAAAKRDAQEGLRSLPLSEVLVTSRGARVFVESLVVVRRGRVGRHGGSIPRRLPSRGVRRGRRVGRGGGWRRRRSHLPHS